MQLYSELVIMIDLVVHFVLFGALKRKK